MWMFIYNNLKNNWNTRIHIDKLGHLRNKVINAVIFCYNAWDKKA